MIHCSSFLMEDIGSNGIHGDVDAAIRVPFPSLLPCHPPTDSEATATTSASAITAASEPSAEPRRCSDGDGAEMMHAGGPDDASAGKAAPLKRKRAAEGGDEAADAKRSHRQADNASMRPDASCSSSLKSLPEDLLPSSSQQQERLCSTCNKKRSPSANDEVIEIDELDFDGGHEQTPADRIRTALHKYVAAAKLRKKRLAEDTSKAAGGGVVAGDRAGSTSESPSSSVVSERRGDRAAESSEARVGDAQGEQAKPPAQKQRTIQVIMGWMDSFQDHEKIQLICLQALPTILESPPNRLAAQSDGLASIVLYDMAAFPNNSLLQLTAFHTLVVLLRPLGTNEGAVHQMRVTSCEAAAKSALAKGRGADAPADKAARTIRSIDRRKPRRPRKASINALVGGSGGQKHPLLDAVHEPSWTENGVRVMLDSLRRFSSDRYLQAMGCWAMVNAALYPTLKRSLLRLGGVYAVTNAMMLHPNVEAVQFRGLFALINLVIPESKSKDKECRTPNDGSSIHSHIYQIARLTIVAMKNFHSNKSILNRGCLVLRNLSLTPAFVKILARTPGCIDMLLHCRQVCGPRDALVQRSARTIMILVQRAVADEKKEGGLESSGEGGALSIALRGSPLDRPKF